MNVMLIDYAPGREIPKTLEALNRTAANIRGDGMLRMHATGRLLDELCRIADELGFDAKDDGTFTVRFQPRPSPAPTA